MITAALVAAGARVLAVELHPQRIRQLQRRFDGLETVTVLALDLLAFRLPSRPFRVVANPPWSLAKPVIRILTAPGSNLQAADLLLQRRLVADVVARGAPGSGRRHFSCHQIGTVPRAAFQPPPPHAAGVLRIAAERRRTHRG